MKILLILRHAKSKRGPEYSTDEERPLTKRGKEDAARLGQTLRERGLLPDLVISSPAKRAQQTAARVCEALGYEGDIVLQDSLYFSGVAEQLAMLQRLPDAVQTVLLVGHNPDLEGLAAHLTGRAVELRTATLVQIDVPIANWIELAEGSGEAKLLLSPPV